MASASGNLSIVFNGEIYNHLSLREQLLNQKKFNHWRGTSDTETLIQAIDFWGINETLQNLMVCLHFLFGIEIQKLYI